MGSGVLLAILVAVWFIVLVPMVVTRGDLAATPAEPMRVLRRRSDRSGRAMTSKDQAIGRSAKLTPDVEQTDTVPIPKLPRRPVGATILEEQQRLDRLRSADRGPAAGSAPAVPEGGPARPEVDIRARRRRMLTGLVCLAVLWALFAAFWQPVLWWPQIVLDLVVFSYLVFLRLEAQREQDREERRRARTGAEVRLPEDRQQRLDRARSQYQAHVAAATEHQAIALDDDDPSFAEIPTWTPTPEPRAVAEIPDWSYRKAV